VRAQHDAALEPQDQVLADRLDRLEATAVELPRDVLGLRARMRRLDLDALSDENLEATRRAVERVPFRHGASLAR
jgi:hypothetical protein